MSAVGQLIVDFHRSLAFKKIEGRPATHGASKPKANGFSLSREIYGASKLQTNVKLCLQEGLHFRLENCMLEAYFVLSLRGFSL